jgi:hypothetical protein
MVGIGDLQMGLLHAKGCTKYKILFIGLRASPPVLRKSLSIIKFNV